MGFLNESCSSLLAPLRHSLSNEKVETCDSAEDKDCARDFDIADSMEKGLAHELVADFMEPLPDASSLWKFNVERSDNRQHYRLFCDGGEFLMYARVARNARHMDIFLYDPAQKESTLYDPTRPAFTLDSDVTGTDWRLFQERCDYCRHAPSEFSCPCGGRQEILSVQHSSVNVGQGVNHYMEVHVPGDALFASTREYRFITKMPVWNKKVQCLVLDFKGRKILASSKNFQLAAAGDERERVVCQYGKLANNVFGLDFKYPLSVIQAFGLSLTTLLWA